MENLNKHQDMAVKHGEGPLLVLAGAGSGKTKVLIHRVAHLIQEHEVDPKKITLLTFTNKAADEMRSRINSLIGSKGLDLGFVGTFHSFCVKLIREYHLIVDLPNNFLIVDSDDSESLMKSVFKEMNLKDDDLKPKVVLSIIGKMKNNLVTREEMLNEKNNFFYKKVAEIWKNYQNKLTRSKVLDFDDLLLKCIAILKYESAKQEINEKIQWVLVDEYQDTNKAQFEITKLLAGYRKNLTAVGDASQAIYSFRGADFRNLLLLEEEYPEIAKIDLPKNYRSTQKILDGAFEVIKNNNSHPTIMLEADKETGEKIKLIESDDERQEARKVVKIANDLSAAGEVGILYRVNSLSRSLEEELIKNQVAYRLVGGVRFYNRAEIKDLLAYLRLTINREDEVSRTRIEKLGKRRAVKFYEWLNEQPNTELEVNPGTLLKKIIQNVGYLEKFDQNDESDSNRLENIDELLAVAYEHEDSLAFLESTTLAEAEAKRSQRNARITLMTIHAAKGLEFDSVIVVGLEEGLFPHSRSVLLGSKEEIEEERRLMYVAMTRAKTKLYLSFARSRLVFGGRNRTIPSRFLSEIKDDLLEKDSNNSDKNVANEFEGKRKVVADWEIDMETRGDFADIDNW